MTKILRDIGQCSVTSNGVDYVFTPSFLSISQLGESAEIIRKFEYINDPVSFAEIKDSYNQYTKSIRWGYLTKLSMDAAMEMLIACAEVKLPESLIGGWDGDGRYVLSDRRYGMSPRDIIIMARCLINHGLIGNADGRGGTDKGTGEFKVQSFISFSAANFGMSRQDAQNLTMVEFQEMFEMKFPEVKDKANDDADLEKAQKTYDHIAELRKRRAEMNQNG